MSKDFDFDSPQQQNNQQRVDFKEVFFNPEKGINLIRVASLTGKSFKSHFHKGKTGDKKFVKCPGAGCPLCISGDKTSTRYFLKVIDRKSNKLKVWEFGSQIKTQIQEFVNDIRTRISSKQTDADDKLTDYNIEIRRREPGANPLYSINVRERLTTDSRQQAIVEADAKIIAEDKLNLDDLAKPWTIDRIKTQILGGAEAPSTQPQTAAPAPAVAAPRVPVAATATVAKPDVQALAAQASKMGSEDDSWLND